MKDVAEKTLMETAPVEKRRVAHDTAFGQPRDFLTNHLVYLVISPRAHGLSIGVNLNPDKLCNFDCSYCEVDRDEPVGAKLDVESMTFELRKTLEFVRAGRLHERPNYHILSKELLQLHQVSLSGDGEPTLAPNFAEAAQSVIRIRALGEFPFFKIVLITNGSGLDRPQVREGLKNFIHTDEIWVKLDCGTQAYFEKINKSKVPLDKLLENILSTARERPVIIQSLFATINDEEPPAEEIKEYAYRLKELKSEGAQIPLVQIYSASRPMAHAECGHLPLKSLSQIAQTVRQISGLKAEVF